MKELKPKTSWEQMKEDAKIWIVLLIFVWIFVTYKNAIINSYKNNQWGKFILLVGFLVIWLVLVCNEYIKRQNQLHF